MSQFSSVNSIEGCLGTADNNFSAQPGNFTAGWDYVIVTASNEAQASSYRQQIKYRLDNGFLQSGPCYSVLPDPEGKRIGSGGAAFNILKHIRETSKDEDCFSGKRILVINSGGDSKRIPQYSACGKIFSPVPRELSEGVSAALFDEIIKSVAELPSRLPAGMLTITGDILLVFNPLLVDVGEFEAAAISVKENILIGINHGVFIPGEAGIVKKFMHKSSLEDLEKYGAKDSGGNVHLDTGAIWFGVNVINDLFKIITREGQVSDEKIEAFVNEETRLSFYADFVYPMARDSSLDRFYLEKPENGYTDALRFCRTQIWEALHKYPMKLVDLSPAHFIHFGTTMELLRMMSADIEKYDYLGWKRAVNTNTVTTGSFNANSSQIDSNSKIGENSYIEYSSIFHSKIGRNCIISNITVNSVEIPDDVVLHGLKQNDGKYVARIYGINDDPKLGMEDGGTFLGVPIRDFLKEHELTIAEVWDSEPSSLWNAKLYLKCDSLQQSSAHALNLCNNASKTCEIGQRVSLKQSYENADMGDVFKIKQN